MTTPNNRTFMAVAPGMKTTFVAMKDAKPKMYSGMITAIDKAKKLLIIETAFNKATDTIPFDSIKSIQLDEEYFPNALYAARFASVIDANGNQQWVLGNPPNAIPDSAGVPPPAQPPQPPARPKPPYTFTPDGSYNIGIYDTLPPDLKDFFLNDDVIFMPTELFDNCIILEFEK